MTTDEKAAAFDNLAAAMTNRWSDGEWSWWNPQPSCGTATKRATQEEAVADLVAWAEKMAVQQRKRHARLI
jgi:hypothetical protein